MTKTDTFTTITLADLNGKCLTVLRPSSSSGRSLIPENRLTFAPVDSTQFETIAHAAEPGNSIQNFSMVFSKVQIDVQYLPCTWSEGTAGQEGGGHIPTT